MSKPDVYVQRDLFKFASDEAMRAGGDDPRLVAQAAEVIYRHSPIGHVDAAARPTTVFRNTTTATENRVG